MSDLECCMRRSYVSKEKGIRGILKDSSDDFIVEEIDRDGKIVELVKEEAPPGLSYCIHLQCRR